MNSAQDQSLTDGKRETFDDTGAPIHPFGSDHPAIPSIITTGDLTTPPEACPRLRSGVAPACGPPLLEWPAQFQWDDTPPPALEYVFD